jgi:cytochrome oxidase Cu insertion factor (SCO1/SenC/PrrC family)
MKYFLGLAFSMVALISLQAQATQKPAKKGIPPFDIQLVNGQHFKSSDLRKDQPLMIIYFDPTCDHCHIFINDLLKKIGLFKDVQIVMITYVPLDQVKSYMTGSELSKQPGIKVGTEGTTFVVRYFYDIVQFPYVALHKKDGTLISTYESKVPDPEALAKKLTGIQ